MSQYIESFAYIMSPTYLICVVFYLWSRKSRVPALARLLRSSAIFWAIVLTLTFHFAVLVIATCDGNILYGFTECRLVPRDIANSSLAVIAYSFAGAAIYAAALALIGLFTEWRAARKRRTPE